MSDVESLGETLLELERARIREHELRLESEGLLAGLRALTSSHSGDVILAELLDSLREVLGFEDAFILVGLHGSDLEVAASTAARFQGTVWRPGALLERVGAGQPTAIFEIGSNPEWKEQPETVRRGVESALLIPLGGGDRAALLVCTHGKRGFFGHKHLGLARRFSPLAAQALLAIDLRDALRHRDRFFNVSVELICLIGFDGFFKQLNPLWEKSLGFSAEELLARPVTDFAHPEDRELMARELLRASESARSVSFENRFLCRDGSYRWLLWGAAGSPKEAITYAVARDITERKRAEEELAQSVSLLQATLESTTDGILVVDRQGRIASFNRRFAEMWRIPDEVLAARDNDRAIACAIEQLVDPQAFLAKEREMYMDPAAEAFDVLAFRDGRIVERYSRPQKLGDETVGRVWSFRDVTEMRRSEEVLRASEARFRILFERSPLPMLVHDRDSLRFIEVNNAAIAKYGYSRDEFLELRVPDLLPPEDHSHLLEYFKTPRPAVQSAGEWRHRLKDGTYITVELTSHWLDVSGRRTSLVVAKDLTERIRLEEQLVQSQKIEAIGRLAGGVAHDFNNLLQAMLSLTQVVRSRYSKQEPAEEALRELEAHVTRGAALTRQLLLFSRREVSRRQSIDLNEAIGNAASLLRRLTKENVEFSWVLETHPLWVDGDRGQLEQVLVNLVVNASDAVAEGGEIAVRTGSYPTGEVWFEVQDSGVGIAEEILPRVFEPFFTTKAREKGTGLGLSVVHGIVSQHGGSVQVSSKVGQGSTFRVVLPGCPSLPSSKPSTAGPELDETTGHNERILVVEDEDGARAALAEMLTTAGYDVKAVASGEAAMALPIPATFDLLLTDLVLPGIHGGELATVLAQRWLGLHVIVMSGYTEDEAIVRGVGDGSVRFLQKPFSMASLISEIRAALAGVPG